MSGGSYNYAYSKIEDLADEIIPTTQLRKAFKTHLKKVAKACHDIEWVDSCDYGTGDENEAILACLGSDVSRLVLEESIAELTRLHDELTSVLIHQTTRRMSTGGTK
jgi:hypothetical protein